MSASPARVEKPYSEDRASERARPLIPIAMCTYNGEAYLSEQLVSVGKQMQQPDELVVCDDGSTEDTLRGM
jgi:GT2 family glycosyltransferase